MVESKVLLTEYYATERQSLVEEATRLLHGDRMTAEDVVQTTFLRLLSLITSHSSLLTSSLPALVHTVMFNILRDLWRKHQHEQEYEHQLATAPPWMRQADDVFSVCSAQQITELLEHRLARMDDRTAQVIRMNVIDGMAVSEIAEELQLKYKTAENRLQVGRRQLREYIKKVV